ncbi:MAG: exodeoxyribonuclease VII small subunit [Anaerolineae bacterium]|nr:exodeoxyribonuclease VII small subunit [Anaerolineae bacterium]
MQTSDPELRFEEAYQELVQIVDQLESGNLSLDESMTLFERGRKLIALCESQLNTAELRVSQLLSDTDGNLRIEPLA